MLAYMKPDGEMGMRSTAGTQGFTGETSGHFSEVLVGNFNKVDWEAGTNDKYAKHCSGRWGMVVPQDGPPESGLPSWLRERMLKSKDQA
jgi:hypothetical protein